MDAYQHRVPTSNPTCCGGARHRRKGSPIEREIVALHKALGVHAERYPLSGAGLFRGSGHDVEVYALGCDEAQPCKASQEILRREKSRCIAWAKSRSRATAS
jgi:hypothetical protein